MFHFVSSRKKGIVLVDHPAFVFFLSYKQSQISACLQSGIECWCYGIERMLKIMFSCQEYGRKQSYDKGEKVKEWKIFLFLLFFSLLPNRRIMYSGDIW